jgi:hypothetical protein
MDENESDIVHQVENYRRIVLLYEALDEQIDEFLMAHGGTTEHLAAEDLDRYRELARQRDDLQNEMRALERTLLFDDESET